MGFFSLNLASPPLNLSICLLNNMLNLRVLNTKLAIDSFYAYVN